MEKNIEIKSAEEELAERVRDYVLTYGSLLNMDRTSLDVRFNL